MNLVVRRVGIPVAHEFIAALGAVGSVGDFIGDQVLVGGSCQGRVRMEQAGGDIVGEVIRGIERNRSSARRYTRIVARGKFRKEGGGFRMAGGRHRVDGPACEALVCFAGQRSKYIVMLGQVGRFLGAVRLVHMHADIAGSLDDLGVLCEEFDGGGIRFRLAAGKGQGGLVRARRHCQGVDFH